MASILTSEQFKALTQPILGLSIKTTERGHGLLLIFELSEHSDIASGDKHGATITLNWNWHIERRNMVVCGSWSDESDIINEIQTFRHLTIKSLSVNVKQHLLVVTLSDKSRIRALEADDNRSTWQIQFTDSSNRQKWIALIDGQITVSDQPSFDALKPLTLLTTPVLDRSDIDDQTMSELENQIHPIKDFNELTYKEILNYAIVIRKNSQLLRENLPPVLKKLSGFDLDSSLKQLETYEAMLSTLEDDELKQIPTKENDFSSIIAKRSGFPLVEVKFMFKQLMQTKKLVNESRSYSDSPGPKNCS